MKGDFMRYEHIDSLRPGERFSYKGFEWITLDQVDGGILAVTDGRWNDRDYAFDDNGNNNYAKSTLRKRLNDELLPVLGEENLLYHIVDLTADNGDTSYGKVEDKVFILTCDEHRKYRDYIPLPSEWMWTATPRYITESGNGYFTRGADAAGVLHSYSAGNGGGVSPACIFNPKNLKLRRQAQMVEV